MTPEERQMLAGLFDRVNAAGANSRDPQAETFINDAVRTAPYAPYVLAQTVLVQQQALEAAAHRIADLEAATAHAAQGGQEQGSFLGNLGRSIFGGGAPSAPAAAAEHGSRLSAAAPRRRPVTRPRRPRATRRSGPVRGAARPSRRLLIRSSRRLLIRSRAEAAASCRTPPRPRRASPAASPSAICSAACFPAIRAAACSAAVRTQACSAAASRAAPRRSTSSKSAPGQRRPGPVRSEHAGRRGLHRQFVVRRQFGRRQFGRRLRRRVTGRGAARVPLSLPASACGERVRSDGGYSQRCHARERGPWRASDASRRFYRPRVPLSGFASSQP